MISCAQREKLKRYVRSLWHEDPRNITMSHCGLIATQEHPPDGVETLESLGGPTGRLILMKSGGGLQRPGAETATEKGTVFQS